MSGAHAEGTRHPRLPLPVVALVLALLLGLLAIRSGDPWRWMHDDNGRRYSSYARTHRALGLGVTRGRDFFYDPRTGRLVPYGHHPPALGLLLAGWFAATGHDGPQAARALAASFHLVSAVLVLGLARAYWAPAPALVAALAFAVVPMSAFFGKMVNFEPLVLPFFIGAIVSWWRGTEAGRGGRPGLTGALVVLGTLIDWPILLVLPVLLADGVRRWRRGEGTAAVLAALGVTGVALAVAAAVAVWTSGAVGLGELGAAASFRFHLHGRYPWWELAGKLFDYNRRYFTEPVLAAAAVTAGILVRDAWRGRPSVPRTRLLALLGVAGLLPVVLFPTSARYHAYWQFYLLPYETLAVADVLERVGARLRPAPRRLGYAVVVLWLVGASAVTLRTRYTRPSGYVERKVRELSPYL
jgi:4-amino-4-deoxy-L-arabinose transferase-like glycosyltransferase